MMLQQKEGDLVKYARDVFDTLSRLGLIAYRRISTTAILRGNFRTNNLRLSKNSQAGMSDFQVYLKGGTTLHLEAKSQRGKQNENQIIFENELSKLGHFYYVFRSPAQLTEILKKHGIEV
jgi:hypothetical protein